MVTILSFNRTPSEQNLIEHGCRKEIACRSDEGMHFIPISDEQNLQPFYTEDRAIDLIYFEIKELPDIERLKLLRKREPKAMLALFTSPSISPVRYLRPGISPDILILRPFKREAFVDNNSELFEAYFSKQEAEDEECFILKNREERMRLPFEKISCFEARNKKIYLRVGSEEYEFYDTLENIAARVPNYFIRCHRAYLVNGKKVKNVYMAQGYMELYGGITVPFSRTYRQSVKEFVK